MDCIIIDDDKLSRRLLEELINKTAGLNLKKSFADAIGAINYLKDDTEVHLIFLDIEMPDMNGIEFLNSMKAQPQVIIVSSKGKYAIDAFEYDVTDYLLKPVSYTRFYKAIDKATSRFEKERVEMVEKGEIFIKKHSTLVRLKYSEILWIEALENYVIFNTFREKYTIHFTMKAIELKLPVNMFTRVHRSFIVNTGIIDTIEDNCVLVKTDDGIKSIPIGKSYKGKLMKDINLIIK